MPRVSSFPARALIGRSKVLESRNQDPGISRSCDRPPSDERTEPLVVLCYPPSSAHIKCPIVVGMDDRLSFPRLRLMATVVSISTVKCLEGFLAELVEEIDTAKL